MSVEEDPPLRLHPLLLLLHPVDHGLAGHEVVQRVVVAVEAVEVGGRFSKQDKEQTIVTLDFLCVYKLSNWEIGKDGMAKG